MASDHEKEFQIDLDRTAEFFKHLQPELVQPSLDIVKDLSVDKWLRDDVYRIFHQSFKMYKFSVHVYTLVAAMLAPLGFCPADKGEDENLHDLIKALEYWRFDKTFVKLVQDAIFTKFDPACQTDNWHGDTLKMTAGFYVAKEVCEGSLQAMKAMATGEGFLWKKGSLSQDDALFLEVWNPIGMTFRYGGYREEAKAVQEKSIALLKEKLKT